MDIGSSAHCGCIAQLICHFFDHISSQLLPLITIRLTCQNLLACRSLQLIIQIAGSKHTRHPCTKVLCAVHFAFTLITANTCAQIVIDISTIHDLLVTVVIEVFKSSRFSIVNCDYFCCLLATDKV